MTKSVMSVCVLCNTGFIDTMHIKSPPSKKKNCVVRTDNILEKDNLKLNYIIEEGKMIKILQFPLPYPNPNKALNMHI